MGAGAGKHPKTPVESMGAGLNEVKGTLSKDTSQPEKIQQQQKKLMCMLQKLMSTFISLSVYIFDGNLSLPPPPPPQTPNPFHTVTFPQTL